MGGPNGDVPIGREQTDKRKMTWQRRSGKDRLKAPGMGLEASDIRC